MKKIILMPFIIPVSLVIIAFLSHLFLNDSQPNNSSAIFKGLSENPLQKGDRLLGIDITMSNNNDYMDAFSKAKEIGFEFVTLSLAWDDIEKSPEIYDNEYLAIADLFYPSQNTKIVLILSPIDTNNIRLPHDLEGREFNDSEVIGRFNKLIDYVLSQTPNIDYLSVSIGNEIDIYLGNDTSRWAAFEDFFRQTGDYLKLNNKSIGTKITFNGIGKTEAKSINDHSDVIMVTYYPLNSDFTVKNVDVVGQDFEKVISLYPGKEIHFLEIGYPSGILTKSNEQKQADFFVEVFKAWDKNRDFITAVNLNWLHDRSEDEIDRFKEYYGISDKIFLDYLETLGFRRHGGQPKKSFMIIKNESNARGW